MTRGYVLRASKIGQIGYVFSGDEEAGMPDSDAGSVAGDELIETAVVALLNRIPERWAEYDLDALTATENKALFQLVEAGMVERRIRFRMRLMNHPVAVEGTMTATGECGFAEAMSQVSAAMWLEWKDAYVAWRAGEASSAPASFTERLKPDEWRLTDEGVLAWKDLHNRKANVVLDFVLRRGSYDGKPRLIHDSRGWRVARREVVRGSGLLIAIKKVRVEAASPLPVTIGNWEEGADAFASAFKQNFGASDSPAPRANAPEISPAEPRTRAKRTRSSELEVIAEQGIAVCDGVEYRIRGTHAAEFLKKLLDAKGKLITATEFEGLGIRADRVYGELPQAIQRLIDKPGRGQTGYRLRLQRPADEA